MTGRFPLDEVVILTPIYPPATGGAAVYYPVLAQALRDQQIAAQITILTEAYPGEPRQRMSPDGRLQVQRWLPYRAGSPTARRDRHLRYALANLLYGHLLVRRWPRCSALIVHASLHIYPGTLARVLSALRWRLHRPRLIADLRDPRLPLRRQAALHAYDAVITCGAAVTQHLTHPAIAPKCREIPIPLGATPAPANPDATVRRYGLTYGAYVLWTNGLLRRKNLDLALAAVALLRAAGRDVTLAIAGPDRERSSQAARALRADTARYLGPLPHSDIAALSFAAGVVLNVSPVEGMPRAALEALAVGAKVILPPGVPEFARHCPQHVAATGSAEALAAQIAQALDGPWPAHAYPLAAHSLDAVMPRYAETLAPEISKR